MAGLNVMRHAITAAIAFLTLIVLAPVLVSNPAAEVTVETPDASKNETITVNCEGLDLRVYIKTNTRNDTTRITILGKGLTSEDRIKVLACMIEILQSQAPETLRAETPAKATTVGTASIKAATTLMPYSLEKQETSKVFDKEQQGRGEETSKGVAIRVLIAMIAGILGGLFFTRIGRL